MLLHLLECVLALLFLSGLHTRIFRQSSYICRLEPNSLMSMMMKSLSVLFLFLYTNAIDIYLSSLGFSLKESPRCMLNWIFV